MILGGCLAAGGEAPESALPGDEITFLMLGRWVCGRRAGRGGKPCGRSRQGAKRPEGPPTWFPTPERSEPPGARSASSTYPRAARSAVIKEGGPGETIFGHEQRQTPLRGGLRRSRSALALAL